MCFASMSGMFQCFSVFLCLHIAWGRYVIFRYLQLIQGNGSTAIHFNGGIIDWGATGLPSQPTGIHDHGSIDFREWGSAFWFQNIRMAYYPNLQDNDADLLVGLFKHYVAQLDVQRARCKAWFGHAGIFFAETSYFWGSYTPQDYGCGRVKQKDVANPYIWHHIEGGIELAQLMVRHWHYTMDMDVLEHYTIPWTDEVLRWYDLHYERTSNGTILMLNAKACESYNHCTNPAPQIAGLRMVVQGLLSIPTALLGEARHAFLTNFSAQIPEIPLMLSCQGDTSGGKSARCQVGGGAPRPHVVQIAPCLIGLNSSADAPHARGGFPSKSHTVNREAVETYPIWPYEIRELYSDGNTIGQNTQDYRRCERNSSKLQTHRTQFQCIQFVQKLDMLSVSRWVCTTHRSAISNTNARPQHSTLLIENSRKNEEIINRP